MTYLITGGCGFLGSNLASEVIRRGERLVVLDNLYRMGSEKNYQWLQSLGDFTFYRGDMRNPEDVAHVVGLEKPDVVFHVAGQVAMTTSLERPRFDFETNALGTLNLLEALKVHAPRATVIYSSTNKVYGDLEDLEYLETETRFSLPQHPQGLSESVPLDFTTPYGCSKGYADQAMTDYFRCFGMNTVVFRHSSIYGSRQFSSVDQGWIGWFVQKALETKRVAEEQKNPSEARFTISGTGKQVRDVLFSEDLVNCYFQAAEKIEQTKGNVFNIGGGIENSLSLLELFSLLEQQLGIEMLFDKLPARKSDQKFFVADVAKAKQLFSWRPQVSKEEGIEKMIGWVDSCKS